MLQEVVGPADDANYANATFLLKHDTTEDGVVDFNLALDGDRLSTDAAPFIFQNTNPNGEFVFQTGANTTNRLIIDADGSVRVSSPSGDIPTITYE